MSQADRAGRLYTPFGDDVLVLLRFDGTESVNELFEFTVDAMTSSKTLNLNDAVGQHCTVELGSIAHGARYFDGLLTEITALGLVEGGIGYRLTLRPWLWLLDQRRNQRIFHDVTPQDIIQTIISEYGFNVEITASGLPTLEYTVQFGETDLTFIRRMMERFGLNFYFVHDKNKHDLIINDGNFATPIPGDTRVVLTSANQHLGDEEHFEGWTSDRRITTGRVKLTDYNFKTPTASMGAEQSGTAEYSHHDIEAYEYPGGYLDGGEGSNVAKLRLKQVRAEDNRNRAEGDAMTLAAGMVVKLKSDEDENLDGKSFVALSCSHSFVSQSYSSGGSAGTAGENHYSGAYEFSPKDQPIVPARVTPRAVIRGPHVAVVTGGGEIDSDEFGRITVQFPWDADGAMSMRCRVLQPWAGNGFGNIFIPRIGMEVVVEFLDGDPDFPVVVGCLYNGQNSPPYGLPGQQNIAGIKSNSVSGSGYNEFILDDTGGAELIRTHAQYDMESTVENDERRTVKNNRTTEIDVNDTRTVKGNDKEDITGTMKTTVSQSKSTDVTTTYEITAKSHFKVTVGMCELMMDGTKIELKVGPSKVTLDAMNVTLEGMNIKSTAELALETSSKLSSKHDGGITMTIKGVMVLIN